jgi:hypothetical protein
MLPLVRPVASVKSDSEVPAYPFLLKIGAVVSTINRRVRSAFDKFLFHNANIPVGRMKLFVLSIVFLLLMIAY